MLELLTSEFVCVSPIDGVADGEIVSVTSLACASAGNTAGSTECVSPWPLRDVKARLGAKSERYSRFFLSSLMGSGAVLGLLPHRQRLPAAE